MPRQRAERILAGVDLNRDAVGLAESQCELGRRHRAQLARLPGEDEAESIRCRRVDPERLWVGMPRAPPALVAQHIAPERDVTCHGPQATSIGCVEERRTA